MTTHSRPAVRRLLSLTLAAGLLVAACGGDDDDADSGTTEPAEQTTESGGDTADDAADADADDDETADGDDTADASGDEPADDTADGGPDDGGEPSDDGDAIADAGEDREEAVEVTLAPEENSEPVMGGTLRYGLEADVNGINPAASSLSAPGVMMGMAVFDTLAASTPDGGWAPYLAESFTPNDDLTQWTMKLREGITFHDGTPLNSDAIVTNFESQRGHPLVGLAVKPFFPEEGAITVVDDLTVTFNMLEPNANFPSAVTGQLGMVASPAWLAASLDDGALNQAPIGTGPFMFESRSEDSVTRFVRNPDWWGGDVYLDAVEFYPVTDDDARNELLFGDELDALQTTNQASILDLTADDSVQNVLSDAGEESFAMINSAAPPFDDVRARRALALATPVDLYNELIGLGVNRPADQMFTPDSPFYNPDVVQEHDDPEGALALVAEYCAERGGDENPVAGGPTCTDGKINIEYQWAGPAVVDTRIADLLNEGWSNAGFNVTFDELLQDEHISQAAFGQYNVAGWRQFGANNPADDRVWLMCRTIGGISLNWPRFCDEERDALILQIVATADPEAQVPMWQELVQKIHDDYLYVFYNHTLWDNAFAEEVHGVCDRTSPEGTQLKCSSNGVTWFSSIWMD
jgi:peptide/nickel transport system substrate-binding protein